MADGRPAARVLDILEAAFDRPDGERDTWLESAHGDDPDLVAEVRRLIARDRDAPRRLPTRPLAGAASTPALAVPERVGPYRVGPRLGAGGMGVVHAAERDDGLFEHAVAIKFLPDGQETRLGERFAVERRALARLTHPNIARLLDGGITAGGVCYIVMERVDGRSIADHVAGADPADRETVRLFRQACLAVSEAHQRLVAHGDLKPSNVLVRIDGEVRVLDFGVARLLDGADQAEDALPLTTAYAAPERRAGGSPDVADDIHALGVLLDELITRRGPSLGDGEGARAASRDLAAIAARARAASTADRYGSVTALIADLDRWTRREPVTARQPSLTYRIERLFARRPLASAAVVAGTAFLLGSSIAMSLLYVRAETERREAVARFEDARGMGRYMLFDLAEGLGQAPGNLALRRDLIDTARAYLERLSGSAHASPSVGADAALGYIQLASLLGFQEGGNLGRREDGRAMLARAQALMDHPLRGADADPAWRHAKGRLALFQGYVALMINDDAETAGALLARADRDLTAAAALAPTSAGDVLADLWETRLISAGRLVTVGEAAEARRLIQRELDAWPGRRARMQGLSKAPLLLALSHIGLGDAFYAEENYPASAAAYGRAVDILTAEDKARPDRPRTLSLLVQALWSQGGAADAGGDMARGLSLTKVAQGIGRRRLAAEPENDQLWRLVMIVESDLAAMLGRAGRRGEASALADRLTADLRARMNPTADQVMQRFAINMRRPLADARMAAGDRAAACAEYRALVRDWAVFDARFPVKAEIYQQERERAADSARACPR